MQNQTKFNLSNVPQQKRRMTLFSQPSPQKVREEQVLAQFGPKAIKQMAQKWDRITNWL